MNKGLFRFFCAGFLVLGGLFLWAQDDITRDDIAGSESLATLPSWDDEKVEPVKETFRFKNRMVELSLLNMRISASNDFIKLPNLFRDPFYMIRSNGDIWKDPVVINIDEFLNGFKFDFGAVVLPLALHFNWRDEWGFGLEAGRVDVLGNVSLSGNLLTLKETESDIFGVGAAVFADAGIPIFFFVNDFKIKLRPAVYLPMVYTEPNITYSYKKSVNPDTGAEGMRLEVNYDMRIYSPLNMQNMNPGDLGAMAQNLWNNAWDIAGNNLGYDFGLCIEYPWDYWLDIGIDVANIPIPYASAKLNHFLQLDGQAFFDTSNIDIAEMIDTGNLPDDLYGYPEEIELKPGTTSEGKKIHRPFKTMFYAKYRPFEGQVFTILPSIGFSINHLYTKPAAIEGGLSFLWDIANIFIPTIGINYNDRKWKNSLDIVLNLRAFELDFGISFQSTDFVKSFQGAGLGVNAGVKLGW